MDARHKFGPATGLDQPQDGNQQRAQPNKEELEHLVEDRREQASQGHVDPHGERRHPDAEVDVPAQHHLHDQRHRVHVDPRHEQGHEGKHHRGEAAGGLSVAELQVTGNGVGLGNVIERHHDEPEEQDGRDRADPVPMRRQDAVLIGGSRPAHQFQGAKVSGNKAEARHPGRHFPACQEKTLATLRIALQVEANPQDHREVNADDQQVHRFQENESLGGIGRIRGSEPQHGQRKREG